MSDRVSAMRQDILGGPISSSMIRLAWPVAASMVLQTLFGIIDAIWVGHLGAASLAGVSTGGFAIWALFSLMSMVSVGLTALVARRVGAGDHDDAARIAGQGLLLSVVIGSVFAVLSLAGLDALFQYMQTDADVTREGKLYFGTIAASMPALFGFAAVNAVFGGAGDTRTTLRLSGGAVVLAGVLDPFLIYGIGPFPMLGVLGAGLATGISRVVFLVIGIAYLVRNRTGVRVTFPRFAPDWDTWRRILRIGAPASVAGFVNSVVYVSLTRVTTTFGTPAVAGLGACHRLEGLNYLLGVGFAAAASAYVGQNLGARQPSRAEQGAWRACLLDSAPVGLISLLFLTVPEILLSIFTDDPQVIAAGAAYLRIVSIAQVLQALELVLDGAFDGAGDTLPPMLISVPISLLRYPLAVLLTGPVGLPVTAVWWVISGTTVVKGSAIAYWFSRGRWKTMRV